MTHRSAETAELVGKAVGKTTEGAHMSDADVDEHVRYQMPD